MVTPSGWTPNGGIHLSIPESGVHVTYAKCLRKPDAGMFYFAAQHFGAQVDLADSYMIGDMTTDIGAGKKAETTTILVQTGFAGKDGKVNAQPDFIKKDLAEAADIILAREGRS